MKNVSVIALLTLVVSACGPDASEKDPVVIINNGAANNGAANNGAANNGAANNGMSATDEALVQGITAPQDAKDAADGALALTVEAAFRASLALGGEVLVTTGTLKQSGQDFTYSATPSDRLVIEWSQGPPTEIIIDQLDGNFAAETVDAFFGDNHFVSARIKREGSADFAVGSAKNGGDREGGIVGALTSEGVTYQLDLREVGSTRSDIGSTAEYESSSTMTGTITAPGLSLQAEESHTFKSIYVDNLVVNRSRTANSVWTYNGTQYAVQNLFIRTAETNGYPDELDFWRVEGVVTRDGQVVGEVTSEVDQFKIDIFVLLEGGERVQLESYTRFQE